MTARKTTIAGYKNRQGQVNLGRTKPPRFGNDHGQYVYVMHCPTCRANYGANGSDLFQRRCPVHDDGAPGLPLTPEEEKWTPPHG